MDQLISLPEFKGKKIWVDLWYSSCSPCIEDFQKYSNERKKLEENGWIVLFLGRETSHPDSYSRWLNAIEKYDLRGVHYYMSKPFESQIQQQIQKKINERLGYPHYLVVSIQGEVVNWDAHFEEGHLQSSIGK